MFEFYLIFEENLITSKKEKIYFKKTNLEFEKRSKIQIYKELKKINKNIKIVASPHYYLYKNDLELFPLSGHSHSQTINCKENGYFSLFESDRYGFNNPDNEWDQNKIEYLIIGDSFAKGSCVNRPNDISSLIRSLYGSSSITLGYNSKGPLMELATLKEYINPRIKRVIWLYFEGNDIYNLQKELKNEFLVNYLKDKNFTQDLINKQVEIDKLSNRLILEILNKKQKENELFESNIFKIKNFIKFYKTRKLFFKKFIDKTDSTFEYKLNSELEKKLEEILRDALYITHSNNSDFYFVYLPAFERYVNKIDNYNYKKIKKIIDKLNIKFIDVNENIFLNLSDPLDYFPFKMNGHYNKQGYSEVAKLIYKITN